MKVVTPPSPKVSAEAHLLIITVVVAEYIMLSFEYTAHSTNTPHVENHLTAGCRNVSLKSNRAHQARKHFCAHSGLE